MNEYGSEMFDPELILPKPVAVNQLPEAQVLAMLNSNEPSNTNPFATIKDLNQFETQEVIFNSQEPKSEQNYLYIDTGMINHANPHPISIPEDYVVTKIFLQDSDPQGRTYAFANESDLSNQFQSVVVESDAIHNVAITSNIYDTIMVGCLDGETEPEAINNCRILVECQRVVFEDNLPETVSFVEAIQTKSNEISILFNGVLNFTQLVTDSYTVDVDDVEDVDILNAEILVDEIDGPTGVKLTIDGTIAEESVVKLSIENLSNFWGGAIPDVTNVQVSIVVGPIT